MKIAPVYSSYKVNKSQNFSGLWGATTSITDYDEGLCIPIVRETSYYYPFLGETIKQINDVVEKNEAASIDQNRLHIKDCKVCTTLPFSEDNYLEYLNAKPNSDLTKLNRIIHNFVSNKYLNNGYGQEQKSADNDVVAKQILIA